MRTGKRKEINVRYKDGLFSLGNTEDDSNSTDEVISIVQFLHNSFIFTLVPVGTSTAVIPVGQGKWEK